MIIMKGTLADVQHDLAIINQVAAVFWAEQGYTVIDTPQGKAVVGKNAATGEDNHEALTTTWAVPAQDEVEGYWYIVDPASDPRFVDWRDRVPQDVFLRTTIGVRENND